MKTLNRIKKELIEYFETHAQINTVLSGNDFDFNAEANISYPAVSIEFLDGSTAGKEMRYSFNITISDLLDSNIEGHADSIYSDTLLIAEEFTAWLGNTEGFIYNKNARFNIFKDDTHDRVAGTAFSVTVGTIRSQNECAKPVK